MSSSRPAGPRRSSSHESRRDKQGRLVERTVRDAGGRVVKRTVYEWNEKNLLSRVVETTTRPRRTHAWKYAYVYGSDGRVSEQILEDSRSKGVKRYKYTWRADGGRTVERVDPPRHADELPETETYDAQGNLTSSCTPSFCKFLRYDRNGTLVETRTQLPNGEHDIRRERRRP